MHSYRVFLQVQSWYGNDSDPLDFGWDMRAGNVLPIGSDRAAAPERLLKLMYCDCQSGCKENSACRCKGQRSIQCYVWTLCWLNVYQCFQYLHGVV